MLGKPFLKLYTASLYTLLYTFTDQIKMAETFLKQETHDNNHHTHVHTFDSQLTDRMWNNMHTQCTYICSKQTKEWYVDTYGQEKCEEFDFRCVANWPIRMSSIQEISAWISHYINSCWLGCCEHTHTQCFSRLSCFKIQSEQHHFLRNTFKSWNTS